MSKPENAVGIGVFEILVHSATSCDVSADDRHVPYVGAVAWDGSTLTIKQGTGTIPGVDPWVLPGAVKDGPYWVSRFSVVDISGHIQYGAPTKVLIWVSELIEGGANDV
jgi:hypothetical protein